jgi:hypothetical protein
VRELLSTLEHCRKRCGVGVSGRCGCEGDPLFIGDGAWWEPQDVFERGGVDLPCLHQARVPIAVTLVQGDNGVSRDGRRCRTEPLRLPVLIGSDFCKGDGGLSSDGDSRGLFVGAPHGVKRSTRPIG